MNSLMFTFSANQMSMQLGQHSKSRQQPSRPLRKRPNSSNVDQGLKSKILSSKIDQLFENSNIQSCAIQQSPQKNISSIKVKNTSIQIQQKKKLRNIIDNMLGKNFDSSNCQNLDSIVVSNKKNNNKHRGYFNGTRQIIQKQQDQDDRQMKQNQFNFQNIDVKSTHQIETFDNDKKKRPNIKIKKFQFANYKINKINQQNQRYPDQQKYEESIKNDRSHINFSRQSIERQSLGKKIVKAKTPKINYPQSDSKLPSVFKSHSTRSSTGNSMHKRTTRISSAHFISEFDDKKNQQSVNITKKSTLQNTRAINYPIRTKFRPQSMMLESKRNIFQKQKQDKTEDSLLPKKLIFDCNIDVTAGINKKLGEKSIQNKNLTMRVSNRAKSTHGYAHRKLRQIHNIINQQSGIKQQDNNCKQNCSQHSKQTAQQSTLQSSTDQADRTLTNFSGKLRKIMQQKQLGCSITFHI